MASQPASAPYPLYEAAPHPDIRVRLMRYARQWKWFMASALGAAAAAYGYLQFQTPVYQTQASLLIKDDKKGLSETSILKEMDILAPKKVIENEVEILQSYALMASVVDRLGLAVRYLVPGTTRNQDCYDLSPLRVVVEKATPALYETPLTMQLVNPAQVTINERTYPTNTSIRLPQGQLRVLVRRPFRTSDGPLIVAIGKPTEVTEGFLKNLTVTPTSKASTVLQLALLDPVPRKARAILSTLIDEYNRTAIADKNRLAASTLSFIDDRLKLIADELAVVEKDVATYKAAEQVVDLGQQSQLFLKTIQLNDEQLNQTAMQLGAVDAIDQYARRQGNEPGLAPATFGLNDPTLVMLVGQLGKLEQAHEQLSRTTGPQNPMLLALESQIAAARTSLTDHVAGLRQQLTHSRQQLSQTNQLLEKRISAVPRKERGLVDITRQQSVKSKLYTYLLGKREETALSFAATVADSRVVDPPRTGRTPVKPVGTTIFLLFGLAGLLLPVGVMAGRDALNDRVSQRTDIESASQVPILGEIAASRTNDPLVMVSGRRSAIAEQIRTLRTNLQFLRTTPTDSQIILFTSSIGGEGKSFLSLNLGASLALVDRPTVILEMDLRKPRLHQVMNMANTVGLSNYLIQEAPLDAVLQDVPGLPNYHIITSGPIPPNPAELLSSPQLGQLFAELRTRFDYIIVDSPPIGLVTDAQLIAPHADATLFMVRHDHTPKAYLTMIDGLYRDNRFNRLNLILNGVGHSESFQYGYAYGGYYETTSKPEKRTLRRLRT